MDLSTIVAQRHALCRPRDLSSYCPGRRAERAHAALRAERDHAAVRLGHSKSETAAVYARVPDGRS